MSSVATEARQDDVAVDRRGRRSWRGAWLRGACWTPSPNQDARPEGSIVDLVVVHSISLPPGEYGGPSIQALFTNRLDPAAHPYFGPLRDLRVSAHFVIRRCGRLEQYVGVDRRAWHAGVSSWDGRSRCNDFSVGVELEGLEGQAFEAAQYRELLHLIRDLREMLPLRAVVGHEHVAPGRKHDPGIGFEGWRLRALSGLDIPHAWDVPARAA
jgi:AmpD protein